MIFLFMRRATCIVLALTSSLTPMLHAQPTKNLTFSSSVNAYNMSDDTELDDSVFYSFGVGYRLSTRWMLEGVYAHSETETSDNNNDIQVEQYRLDALYHLTEDTITGLTPYLATGVGVIKQRRSLEGTSEESSESTLQFNAGSGFKYRLTDSVFLRADMRFLQREDGEGFDQLTSVGFELTFGAGSQKAGNADLFSTKSQAAEDESTALSQPAAYGLAEGKSTGLESMASENTDPENIDPEQITPKETPKAAEPIETPLPLIPPPDVPIGEEPSLLEQAAIVKAQPPVILNIQFAYNKTQVEERFYAEIEKLSVYLKAHPLSTVVIEGHTDNLGDAMYNQHISEKRAQAIANVLMKTFGISDKRVTAIGYGEERPLYKNDTLTHRKANRRVTAVFY